METAKTKATEPEAWRRTPTVPKDIYEAYPSDRDPEAGVDRRPSVRSGACNPTPMPLTTCGGITVFQGP